MENKLLSQLLNVNCTNSNDLIAFWKFHRIVLLDESVVRVGEFLEVTDTHDNVLGIGFFEWDEQERCFNLKINNSCINGFDMIKDYYYIRLSRKEEFEKYQITDEQSINQLEIYKYY